MELLNTQVTLKSFTVRIDEERSCASILRILRIAADKDSIRFASRGNIFILMSHNILTNLKIFANPLKEGRPGQATSAMFQLLDQR